MFKIKIVILIYFLLFFCGCYRNYDIYGFRTVEKKFEWGLVGAKLIGSESRKGNTIIKSSPYELFLWFGSETFIEGAISIKNIALINKRTGNIVFMKGKVPEQLIKKQKTQSGASYFSFFLFENIKMSYENKELQITFQLKQGDKPNKYQVSLLFETDHQKFRRIIGV